MIIRAHKSAGKKISKRLRDSIQREGVLEILIREGHFDFKIPEAPGVVLSAYRIERILSHQKHSIVPSHIGVPFSLDELQKSTKEVL